MCIFMTAGPIKIEAWLLGGVAKEKKTGVHSRDVYGGEIMFRLVTDCQSTQIVEMPLLLKV